MITEFEAKPKLLVLREEWTGCTRCSIGETRQDSRICFGAGPYDADLLVLLGEPSSEDMGTGRPASDPSSRVLLENLFLAGGIDPKRVFVTTVVACWPYTVIPATEEDEERIQNRVPKKAEIQACWPRLHETIYLVDPRIILAMGELAWKALVPPKERHGDTKIQQAQKKLYTTSIHGRYTEIQYPVMVTMSLPQMMGNPSVAKHGPMAMAAQAFNRAAKYVDMIRRSEDE